LHNYTEPLLNELDWPHLGFATGLINKKEKLLIKVKKKQYEMLGNMPF
jgi:hypothetical protein